jgi:hypothetical protein
VCTPPEKTYCLPWFKPESEVAKEMILIKGKKIFYSVDCQAMYDAKEKTFPMHALNLQKEVILQSA